MADLVGTILLCRYRIEELLGRGGMAEVYRAFDPERNYHVAIKVMHPQLAEDWHFDERFRREARAISLLAHRNIVRFYSFEREGPIAFIVMDYVTGITLRRRIFDAHGPLPLEEARRILGQVTMALHYAHGQGLVHRDVKPDNIMLQPDGLALVTDFGIAKATDLSTLTMMATGTPAYMSPEQCQGQPLDQRTDTYSLGVVAYEMLTGRRPFNGDMAKIAAASTRERLYWEHVHVVPPRLRDHNPALPREVEGGVMRALAKDPDQRRLTQAPLADQTADSKWPNLDVGGNTTSCVADTRFLQSYLLGASSYGARALRKTSGHG